MMIYWLLEEANKCPDSTYNVKDNITAVVPNNKASAEGGSVDSEDLHTDSCCGVVGLDARGDISCILRGQLSDLMFLADSGNNKMEEQEAIGFINKGWECI